MLRDCLCPVSGYDVEATEICDIMVFRLRIVPRILGSHDGPLDIRATSDLDATSSFHRRILWIYRSHSVFQFRPPEHDPYPHFSSCTTSMLNMVFSELLSDGIKWPTTSNDIRGSKSSCMDDWMTCARGIQSGL